jgi:hypothetical protein
MTTVSLSKLKIAEAVDAERVHARSVGEPLRLDALFQKAYDTDAYCMAPLYSTSNVMTPSTIHVNLITNENADMLGAKGSITYDLATPDGTHNSGEIVAINDGTWVTVSGNCALTNSAAATTTGAWYCLCRFDCEDSDEADFKLLRPHPAVLGTGYGSATGTAQSGIASCRSWNCGFGFATLTAEIDVDKADANGTVGTVFRIIAVAANKYAILVRFVGAEDGTAPDYTVAAATASGINRICFNWSWPAAPLDDLNKDA